MHPTDDRPRTRARVAARPSPVAVGVLAALLALLVALLPTAPARAADGGAEAELVQLVNQERTSRGLAPLTVAADLVAVARAHSARMADAADLHHNPDLAGEVQGWRKLGENVGRGPGAAAIHGAFMDSPGHRANVLEPVWVEVGIGVEVRDGTVWVTEVFRLPEEARSEASAAAPAAAPQAAAAPQPAPAAPAPQPTAVAATAAPAPAAPAYVVPEPPALGVCTRGDIPPAWVTCPA